MASVSQRSGHYLQAGGIQAGGEELNGINKAKEQLVAELVELDQWIAEVEKLELQRLQAEAALRASEQRYRALFEQANDAIFLSNEKDEIINVNPRACELLGYAREELLAMKVPDLQAPEVRGRPGEVLRDELQRYRGTPLETVNLHRDGRRIPVEVSISRLRGSDEGFVLCIVRDITKRKRAEEELRRRNRELELLNQVMTASAIELDPKAILDATCRELARALEAPRVSAALLDDGKSAVTVVAECLAEGQPPALNQSVCVKDHPGFQYLLTYSAALVVADAQHDPRLEPLHDLIRERGTSALLMAPLMNKDGVIGSLSVEATQSPHFSATDVSLVWGVADQVSGALARAQLARTFQQLSTALEQTVESVVILDNRGTITYVNPAFECTTGYSRAEAIGQRLDILRSDKHDAAFYEQLWATLREGKVWRGRIVNRKKDGTLYTDEATISPVRDARGAIVSYVEVKRDVTHVLQLEERLHQAQRMEAVGRLTAGIAHDFNNLVTAINGFAELAQLRLPPDDAAQALVGKVRDSGRHATGLIRQLLAFSNTQIVEPKVLDLNAVVAEMGTMLQRIIGEDIELVTELAPDLWPVKVDPAHIEQVVVNLAVNARDAMPMGGGLRIEIANIVLGEEDGVHPLEARPGEYALLTVSDTGVGMSQEVKAHLFEPFFTTKEQGKGTGLGLATVYGIVRQSEGHIWVDSEPGRGTSIKIYLPRSTEAPGPLPQLRGSRDLPAGGETILVVEDDDAVRDMARLVLAQQGYVTLDAKDGQQALQAATGHAGPIHLLLADVVMPGMSGPELAGSLVKFHPDLKTLYISGYPDETMAHHGLLEPGSVVLQKPFSPLDLARKARKVLDHGL